MKQLIQDLKTGSTHLLDIPAPKASKGHLIIQTTYSLLSPGTERMLVNFSKANLFNKATQQPEKVKETLQKVKSDGVFATIDAVKTKLDQPLALGYSNVGNVIDIGEGVKGFKIGDRVVSNGPHAELVSVPFNLCSHIPVEVNDETAVFTILASIGLQGIRLANPTLGETFLVSGLGLIGLLTAQLLSSQNCLVLGIDPDPEKCSLAESLGIPSFNCTNGKEPLLWINEHTKGLGVDGVLVTASTSSSEPLHVAAEACRKRGRIVLIGSTGINLKRDLFYKKEITFQVSCSYGPGRYDSIYEKDGIDYPIGFVRWTEQRNFQAILNTFSKKLIKVDSLISKIFNFRNAIEAYDTLIKDKSALGILFKYEEHNIKNEDTINIRRKKEINSFTNSTTPSLGFIGAGNFATRILIPAFAKVGGDLHGIAASSGLNQTHLANKFGFNYATTDVSKLINDNRINTIIISTRHDSHSELILDALNAKKNIFVEKPLCLGSEELNSIKSAYQKTNKILMVGFNRRFAPLISSLKDLIKEINGPKSFVYTCNAGFISPDHWTQDPNLGGGRLIGEACHFVDLLRDLAQSQISNMYLNTAKDYKSCPDTFSINIKFKNGSIGTVHYFSNGNKGFKKERLEVFGDGRVICLDNFLKLKAWGFKRFISKRAIFQDKGHIRGIKYFLEAIEKGRKSPIPIDELFEVQEWLLKLKEGQ